MASVDIIDEKILEVLQQNARISISELSKKINLSLSAVSERLKKLESNGVIRQYTAILNPEDMGKTIAAIIRVSLNNRASGGDFLKLVNAEPDIISCIRTTGDYDYYIQVYSGGPSELQQLLDRVKALRCVERVHSDVFLDTIKACFSVPPSANK